MALGLASVVLSFHLCGAGSAASTCSAGAALGTTGNGHCEQQSQLEHVATVLYGPSQSGKSSLWCAAKRRDDSGFECPSVGDGSGESVTVMPNLTWSNVLGHILDTPGNDDTRLRFTNEEAGRHVALAVVEANITKLRFAVFESLANDRMELRKTLQSLATAFGKEVLASTMVIATKSKEKAKDERKLALIREVMQSQGLSELLALPAEKHVSDSLPVLQEALERVPPVSTYDLQDLLQRQQALAQKLSEEHPGQTTTVEVEVVEPYLENTTEWEEYQEQYIDPKTCTEQYNDIESYNVTISCGGRRRLFAGRRRRRCTEERVRAVPKIREYSCPEIRDRTTSRPKMVSILKNHTRRENRSVAYRLEAEHFMAEALSRIMEEVRETLMKA